MLKTKIPWVSKEGKWKRFLKEGQEGFGDEHGEDATRPKSELGRVSCADNDFSLSSRHVGRWPVVTAVIEC